MDSAGRVQVCVSSSLFLVNRLCNSRTQDSIRFLGYRPVQRVKIIFYYNGRNIPTKEFHTVIGIIRFVNGKQL